MGVWVLIFLLGVIKLPLVALMLWLPFRSDPPPLDDRSDPSQEDGGSKTLPGGGSHGRRHPRGPLPRTPRRGPHGTPSPAPPERVRPVTARGRRLAPRARDRVV